MSLTTRPLMPRLTIYVHGGEAGSRCCKGGTVNRDWSKKLTSRHRGSKILLVVVDVYQSMSHPPYVQLSDCAKLRPQQYSLRPSLTVTDGLSRRSDGSLYCRWVLLWVNNPILDWHGRLQTSHTQAPGLVNKPALRLARLERSDSTRLSSKSVTAS